MNDYFFRDKFEDDVVIEYKISKNNYFYKRIHDGDNIEKWIRISESEYISAYEMYLDEQSLNDICFFAI